MAEKTHALRGHVGEDPDETIANTARRLVVKSLRRGFTTKLLIEMFDNAVSLADGLQATVRLVQGPPKPKACRAGCNYCCYLQVDVSVPEVLRLASYIGETFSPAALAALKDRLRRAASRVRGINSYERMFAKIPCPLLSEGNCSVYEARPLVCRGYNSYSWVACVQELKHPRSWKGVPHDEAQRDIRSNVLDGLIAGLKDGGLRSEALELIAALSIALDQPDAGERWLAGEPVFEAAVVSEE